VGVDMQAMSESKFNMWRACVAASHFDGFVSLEERKWVEEKIHKLPLSNDQRLLLITDLEVPHNFEECVSKISDKVDLAFLLNTLRVIGHLDKSFSDLEKDKFKKLEDVILKNLDLQSISAEIEKIELQSYHEDEIYKNYTSSIFERIAHSFMRYINPGDYKFPDKK
jgi:hypothetical protein